MHIFGNYAFKKFANTTLQNVKNDSKLRIMDKNLAIIRTAEKKELHIIQHIASITYGPTYLSILGKAQVDYMLGKIYSLEALSKQFEQGHVFIIAHKNNSDVGFASYSLADAIRNIYQLQKLYLLPELQGTGLGAWMVQEVIAQVRQRGGQTLQLNVNRFNRAKGFYEKLGFTVKGIVDIPIGEEYFMNDYVMELDI